MKIKLLITLILVFNISFAHSFQLPAQQSAQIIKKVIDLILADNGLRTSIISKITIGNDFNRAKAELVDMQGKCLAIPYSVSFDSLDEIEVKVDTAAFATCNSN